MDCPVSGANKHRIRESIGTGKPVRAAELPVPAERGVISGPCVGGMWCLVSGVTHTSWCYGLVMPCRSNAGVLMRRVLCHYTAIR